MYRQKLEKFKLLEYWLFHAGNPVLNSQQVSSEMW